jgi:hypothetical protein
LEDKKKMNFGREKTTVPGFRFIMKKNRVIILIISLVFIIPVIVLWAFWEIKLKPGFIAENTRIQMFFIKDGMEEFVKRENRLPVSLEEVVKAGDLPEEDILYFNQMKHLAFRNKELRYTECEFDLSFEPNEVRICIPEKVFYQQRFRWLHKYYNRCMIITNDGKLTSG